VTRSVEVRASARVETCAVEALRIFDAPKLDPIFVVLHDMGGGRGRLLIDCWGEAWAAYWGAMGERTLRQFITGCDTDYIANRLWPDRRRRTKREYEYLTRIVCVVQDALRTDDEVSRG
jgi:hypothetical protein